MDLSTPQSNLLWFTNCTTGVALPFLAVAVPPATTPVDVGIAGLLVAPLEGLAELDDAVGVELERALLEPTTPPTMAAMITAREMMEMTMIFFFLEVPLDC